MSTKDIDPLQDYFYRLDEVEAKYPLGTVHVDVWLKEFHRVMKGNAIYEETKTTPSQILHEDADRAYRNILREDI